MKGWSEIGGKMKGWSDIGTKDEIKGIYEIVEGQSEMGGRGRGERRRGERGRDLFVSSNRRKEFSRR